MWSCVEAGNALSFGQTLVRLDRLTGTGRGGGSWEHEELEQAQDTVMRAPWVALASAVASVSTKRNAMKVFIKHL